MSRLTLQDVMKTQHPIFTYLAEKPETLTDFAARIGLSRMQVYRIIRGENVTLSAMQKVCAGSDGKISMVDLAGALGEVAA